MDTPATPPRPPRPPPPAWENFPAELLPLHLWVNWRYDLRKNKWTKPPYRPDGALADSMDPKTWSSFDEARTGYLSNDASDGVGIALNGDGLSGFDFDHCLNADGTINDPEIADFVRQLNSYTEISPSRTGLRVFVRGTLPPGGRKRGNRECYERGRYLTVTGAHLQGTPTTIEDRQEEIDAVHAAIFASRAKAEDIWKRATGTKGPAGHADSDILQLARTAKNGEKFIALFDRADHAAAGQPSLSECDLALCNLLAFWTGKDAVHMDALYRSSALYSGREEKWERLGPSTIAKAIASCTETYTAQNDRVEFVHDCNEPPRPLTQEIPEVEEYPTDALGPILGPAAHAIYERTQAPLAICAQSVLSAAALAVQAHADIQLPSGQIHPVSEYFVAVAGSGDRKTSADDMAMETAADAEKRLGRIYTEEFKIYANAKAAHDRQRTQVLSDRENRADAAAKRDALVALGSEPEAPLLPILILPEPTIEGLTRCFREGRPSLGLFSSEGGQMIGGYAMSEENRLHTGSTLSKLWEGKPITRSRGGDGNYILLGRRLSMHLLLQPVVADKLFGDPSLRDQGLLSRILATLPASLAGSRMWRGNATADQIQNLAKYQQTMRTALDAPLPFAEGTRNELQPRVLELSLDATDLWISFHDSVEVQISPNGPLDGCRGLASKLPEHAARLAAVMALFANLRAKEVSEGEMANGIELANFYLTEALRIYRISKIDPDLVLAQRVLAWIREQWDCPYVSLPDLYQRGPTSVRDQSIARRVVGVLVNHGWLKRCEKPVEVRGSMRREVWRIAGKG